MGFKQQVTHLVAPPRLQNRRCLRFGKYESNERAPTTSLSTQLASRCGSRGMSSILETKTRHGGELERKIQKENEKVYK